MSSSNRKIFIDSSVFTAFVDRGNPRHMHAAKALEATASIGYRLYTTPPIIADAYEELMKQVGTTVALEFLQTTLQSGMEIIFKQKTDLNAAYRILKINRTEQISLNEAISAALMQRKGITTILTFNPWHNLFGTTASTLVVM
jgi:predicted nucleic acid-binding protein